MVYNTIVVGGGAIGCIASAKAVEDGDVLLIEEHTRQPVHCAGLISISGLEKLGIKPGDWVENRANGAYIYSPLGTRIEVLTNKPKALVVDRSKFDRALLDRALARGVELETGKVKNIGDKEIQLYSKKSISLPDRVILATGTEFELQKKLGANYPKEVLIGAQYEMKIEVEPEIVELHFVVPDFFAWIIPVDDYARIGCATKGNPTPYLENFIRKLRRDRRVKSSRIRQRVYGVIPIHNPKLRTLYEKNFSLLLVGDTASHVKATTGGGVVMGGIAAQQVISQNYETAWREEIGGELKKHLYIYRLLHSLTPKNLDRLFQILAKHHNIIEEYGDMDYASKLLAGFFHSPKFFLDILSKLPFFFMDMIL